MTRSRRLAAAVFALGAMTSTMAAALAPLSLGDAVLRQPRPGAETPAILLAATAETVATAARLPRTRPEPDALAVTEREPRSFHGFAPDPQLAAALDALDGQRYAEARALAAAHPDPLAAQLIGWLVAREPDSDFMPAEMIAAMERYVGWPEPERLALRAEQAFHATGPDPASVIVFYSRTPPRTIGGKLALAAGLREAGRTEEARQIVSELWREATLAPGQSAALITRFGAGLTRYDHLYRFRRLVLNARTADSMAQAKLLGPGYEDLARAVIAVLDRRPDGAKRLRAVAARFSTDPLYVFARIRDLRRADKHLEAGRLLLRSQTDAKLAGDADIWWDERRDVSRAVLDLNEPDLAYKLVSQHRATGEGERAEAAFHCGWYALRFLDDPKRARLHFRDLIGLATLPRTRARASYWLGRTYEAQTTDEAARLAYVEAARFGGTFYGQLAREKLGLATTGLERIPAPSALDRLRFADRVGVRAIRMLAAAGHADRAFPFFQQLAVSTDAPGEITLLNELARRIEQPRAGLIAATAAEKRGLPVSALTAPFLAVPVGLPMPDSIDRALVYSIVRQESAFNHQATSHVGARGLMQLMPATAKETARNAGLPFSVQRLTSDPVYNATLGAEYLGGLMERLDSSYVLTFVGYNAGPGRAFQWVKSYGDPRGGTVDAVDWIERIPFDETRNYVQKVMENLQSYRSRIGYPLSLTEDRKAEPRLAQQPHHANRRQPPLTQHADAFGGRIVTFRSQDGLRLAGRIYGAARSTRLPLLCLPGLSRNSRDFAALGRFFSYHPTEPRTVIALDYRGRGLSESSPDWRSYTPLTEAHDALAAAAAFGVPEAIIVGTSRGGLIAMLISALRPSLIAGVVLNDIGPVVEGTGLARIKRYLSARRTPANWEEAFAVTRDINGPYFPALAEQDWHVFAESYYMQTPRGLEPSFDPHLIKTLQAMDFTDKIPALWSQFAGLGRVPVLAIRGELSDLLSPQTFEEMAERHPALEQLTVQGQGHAPLLRDTPTLGMILAFAGVAETRGRSESRACAAVRRPSVRKTPDKRKARPKPGFPVS